MNALSQEDVYYTYFYIKIDKIEWRSEKRAKMSYAWDFPPWVNIWKKSNIGSQLNWKLYRSKLISSAIINLHQSFF